MNLESLLLRVLLLALFYFVPDFLILPAVKKAFEPKRKMAASRYWIINSTVFVFACIIFLSIRYLPDGLSRVALYLFGVCAGILLSKLLVAIILGMEALLRCITSIVQFLFKKREIGPRKFIRSRRKFIAQSALLLGALPFGGFMYGLFKGRYQFTLHKEVIYFDDLPAAFDGFTITQYSDLHIGSWNIAAKHQLEDAVKLMQSLNSDIVFFTGDIVNSKATEMEGWYETLNVVSAPFGKFSVLGNHDYGDYVNWKSEDEKKANLEAVKNIHPKLGFELLLNEHKRIERDGEMIYLLGVENWGKGDFPKFGDIDKASDNIPPGAFKILLSHDPSHWDEKVLHIEHPPQLTLSGHTHGFQMGIETPAFRFSPSQWVYEQWAGLYQKGNHFIYVNRGLGTVGPPYRIGIWPEITHITLRKKL
jgi:hypothetical protein